jgi:trypsin
MIWSCLLTRLLYSPLTSQLKVFAVISLPLLLGPASARPRGLQTRIVGGSVANPTRYPYFALLSLATVGFPDEFSWCGATLIHQDIVLTAAHCIDSVTSVDKTQSKVYVGLSNYYEPTSEYYEANIQTIVPHPNYTSQSYANDIMILKLDRSITQIKPIALNTERSLPADGAVATVFGFGETLEEEEGSPWVLRELQVESFSDERCDMLWGETFLDDEMLCWPSP